VELGPTIGVSTGFADYGEYLGVALARPVVAAGGVPLVLPYLEDAAARAAALDRVDGVLLGFGRDIDPARYGASTHPALTDVSPLRDAFELALAQEAIESGLPVLGVCRGMQVLNVLRGGTLYRDRSEYPHQAREHPGGDWSRWDEVCAATLGTGPMPAHPIHSIAVRPGTWLAAALGLRAVVNSYHHQALRELGDGVEAVAAAPDGIVEAIALRDTAAPAVGVQWELQQAWQDDPGMLAVFGQLVHAAVRRRESEPVR
jgi:putative glutamine amidotransferase